MLTLDELRGMKINLLIAREAYAQSSQRLADLIDAKKTFEQKAAALFGGYLTACIALLAVAGSLYKDRGLTVTTTAISALELYRRRAERRLRAHVNAPRECVGLRTELPDMNEPSARMADP